MKRLMCLLVFAGAPWAQQPVAAPDVPVSVPSFTGGPALDNTIEAAIRKNQIPGAVVLVGHRGQMVYYKAYGNRSLRPAREPMSLDTLFDVASLTKVVATTASIMKLVEAGQVRLADPVTEYLPQFQGGKSDITVRQLLTHYSGMRPDVDLQPAWSGYDTGIYRALIDRPTAAPDTRFTYSDINFLLLGEIVRRVSGKSLPEYARDEIFAPLEMRETMFTPPSDLLPRIAPTELLPGTFEPLRGVVHDPTARYMGGVAGHAGLFSTAWDLSKFAEMMLNGGERNGVRIFSPLTITAFTSPQSPNGQSAVRGLGWDINSRFSGPRGDLFPVGSFGHTGFTGTSMWIDPHTRSYVIFLANSCHPNLRPAITPLRSRVATIAAAGLPPDSFPATPWSPEFSRTSAFSSAAQPAPRNGEVLTGIDALEADGFQPLRGKRIGLITNHTGVTRDGRRTVDAMIAGGLDIRALYSPEHGIAGQRDDEDIGHGKDDKTGLPVWSLYSGGERKPAAGMLRDIDTLVFDIQDIGARFYTYVCTMKLAMEEAAKQNIAFVVLDRPNPINGKHVEGPVIQPELMSFVGCLAAPLRHGMTVGELAGMMKVESGIKADLQVIRMRGWQRTDWFDSTGLSWVNPSPNMKSLAAALLYPGIGFLEYSKVYSVGRGTDAPFEQIGADWMDGRKLATYLNARNIPGVRVYPTLLTPSASNFAGKKIGGVRFVVTDRERFRPVRFGMELAAGISQLFPGKMSFKGNEKLFGSGNLLRMLEQGADPATVERRFEADTENFRIRRAAFLLY